MLKYPVLLLRPQPASHGPIRRWRLDGPCPADWRRGADDPHREATDRRVPAALTTSGSGSASTLRPGQRRALPRLAARTRTEFRDSPMLSRISFALRAAYGRGLTISGDAVCCTAVVTVATRAGGGRRAGPRPGTGRRRGL